MKSRAALLTAAVLLAFLYGCSESTAPKTVDLTQGVGEGADRLLSDAELLTPINPAPPAVPQAWTQSVTAEAQPLRSLSAARYEDLKFLDDRLSGVRLVQLGESGHGVREFSQAKIRLIKYLHEHLGFDVIAFESGLYEC
jgi:hypothetical protein